MSLAGRLAPPGVKPEEVSTWREVLGGVTTFLTMAYIIFVNPAIVGGGFELVLKQQLHVEELPPEYAALVDAVKLGIATATIVAAAVGTALMAFIGRLPFALAPGMGENAFIGFSVLPAFAAALASMGYSGADAAWLALMAALMAVIVDGLIFLLVAWGGIRERILRAFPQSLAVGIGIGIGLFISFIGLSLAGIVEPGTGTPVAFNVEAFATPSTVLAFLGFLAAAVLHVRRVPGSLLITIVAVAAIGYALGLSKPPSQILAPPSFSTSVLAHLPDAARAYLAIIQLAFPVAFTLWLVEFFDGIGTIMGLAQRAGLVDASGRPVNIGRALYVDAMASVIGGSAGTTTTVIYIESAAGIEAGARTGLASLVTAILFLAFLPVAPLAAAIPSYATAPVLMLVGLMFLQLVNRIKLDDLTEAIPAFVAIIGIPLTYSISTGIALAVITYVVVKALSGRIREVNPAMYVIAALFVIYLASLPALE